MRLTYAIYLDLSLDFILPGFFDSIADYGFAKAVDRGAARVRYEIARIEIENVENDKEASVQLVAQRAAEQLADFCAKRLGIDDWRKIGAASALRVADAPNPTFVHNMGASNASVVCPKCGKPMVHRQGRGSVFWGCSAYPACKGSRKVSK